MNTDRLFAFGWANARRLPTPLGYALAHGGADAAWLAHRALQAVGKKGLRGLGQLEKNIIKVERYAQRPTNPTRIHRLSRSGMRSYMRYFYEALALPAVTQSQLRARVRAELDPRLEDDLADGSVVMALPHMGNWDLAGAWASATLATVLTVAEKLEPEELFHQFVAFRESLGMEIIGQAKGERVFDQLVSRAQTGHYFIPLLADRDLSINGITTQLCGSEARVAAGPAALALRLNRPLYTGTLTYERLSGERRREAGSSWGLVIDVRRIGEPADFGWTSETTRDEARSITSKMTHQWVQQLSELLRDTVTDWHMLQPVFTDDLDMQRLQASHDRARQRQEAEAAGHQLLDTHQEA
ncbi:phosphatidylinositol mannoside acyltransferase [Actinomyces vulturis]|uniref:phosphatidylinositol mannoside acyltransferase n=1 Tax=Actinomyces vulturis TaxID=1857645 RepID=UPI000834A5C5|nr:phosphatidylinositol mannoside acyltransferase [Actinomyces vulturis]